MHGKPLLQITLSKHALWDLFHYWDGMLHNDTILKILLYSQETNTNKK